MPRIKAPEPSKTIALALLLAAGLAAQALAQGGADAKRMATSPLGVKVEIPPGFTQGAIKGTTAINLVETTKSDPQVAILVNVLKMSDDMDQAAFYKLSRSIFEGMKITDEREVVLPSGAYFRCDVRVEEKGRVFKQRCYAALRNRYGYFFFLRNTDEAAFKRLEAAFGGLVSGASFVEPAPPSDESEGEGAPDEPEPEKPAPEKPAPEKPAPEKPAPEKPAPEKPAPEKPAPEKPAKPEGPKKKAPAERVRRAWERLPLRLVSFDSEYDPDRWSAQNLVDNKVDRGWCSSPAKAAPHAFVFDLGSIREVGRIVFDNDCPMDSEDYAGVAAKGFQLEGSAAGAKQGFRRLAAGDLKASNSQSIDVATAKVRWLRLTLTSNHGHASLTELMEFRAYARASAAGFRLDRVRISRVKNGRPLAQGYAFRPGQRLWINFKPRGLRVGEEKKVWFEVDLVLEDTQGRTILRRDKVVDHVGPAPKRPLSPFVSLYIDVPERFPPGNYVLRVLSRDRFAKASAAGRAGFVVGK